jgi:putative transposase
MEQWPHAPLHWLYTPGIYIVTGATLHKENYFTEPKKLDLVQAKLFETAQRYDWNLEAWSILTNHYHFIARSPADANTLRGLIRDFHSGVSREINRMGGVAGRKVLYQFHDETITTERSISLASSTSMATRFIIGLSRMRVTTGGAPRRGLSGWRRDRL